MNQLVSFAKEKVQNQTKLNLTSRPKAKYFNFNDARL